MQPITRESADRHLNATMAAAQAKLEEGDNPQISIGGSTYYLLQSEEYHETWQAIHVIGREEGTTQIHFMVPMPEPQPSQ